MAAQDEGGRTGSVRLREWRLRVHLRYARMSVDMALAEAFHHSSGPRTVQRAQHAAHGESLCRPHGDRHRKLSSEHRS